jgi:hypothetical protein
MRGFHNSAFDPQTVVLLEAAFDEAWLTLKSVGNKTVKPDELARSVLRLAMEGERDPVRIVRRSAGGRDCYPRPPGARLTSYHTRKRSLSLFGKPVNTASAFSSHHRA